MARSGVIYGDTGTFKTTAIAHLARYIAETEGKATLLVSADGGGWTPCEEEVAVGMIRPFRVDTATIPLPMLRKLSQGFWPTNPEETDISKIDFRPIDWREVGAVAIEGFTSIGTMLMRHAADKNLQAGKGEGAMPFSQPIRVNGDIVSETFAGNTQGHYNFVQNQLYGMTMNFTSWPVNYALFTGHEKKAEDADRVTVYGIAVPGKAISALIPTWVGDCIHAQDYQVRRTVKVPKIGGRAGELEDTEIVDTVCRYYFKKHPDPITGIMYPAKPRVAHGNVEALEKEFPGGFFTPTTEGGFDRYLKAMDRLLAEGLVREDATLSNWRKKMDAKLGRGGGTAVAAAARVAADEDKNK